MLKKLALLGIISLLLICACSKKNTAIEVIPEVKTAPEKSTEAAPAAKENTTAEKPAAKEATPAAKESTAKTTETAVKPTVETAAKATEAKPAAENDDTIKKLMAEGAEYRDGNRRNIKKSIEAYTKVLEIQPNHIEALTNRAITHFEWVDVKEGTKDCHAVAKLNKAAGYKLFCDLAEKILKMGDIDFGDGGFERIMSASNELNKQKEHAIALYSEATKLDPKAYLPYFRRGQIYFKEMKLYNPALPELVEADRLKPNDAEIQKDLKRVRDVLSGAVLDFTRRDSNDTDPDEEW